MIVSDGLPQNKWCKLSVVLGGVKIFCGIVLLKWNDLILVRRYGQNFKVTVISQLTLQKRTAKIVHENGNLWQFISGFKCLWRDNWTSNHKLSNSSMCSLVVGNDSWFLCYRSMDQLLPSSDCWEQSLPVGNLNNLTGQNDLVWHDVQHCNTDLLGQWYRR